MHRNQSDPQLMELIAVDDKDAFENLFDRYWEPLFAAAIQRLQSKELAKDIIQELFVDLWENRRTLKIRSNVSGYLYTALKHRIINRIKAEDVRGKYLKIRYWVYTFLVWELMILMMMAMRMYMCMRMMPPGLLKK